MSRTIEVIYEDNVLKPLQPIEGIKEHEKVLATIYPRIAKKGLHEIAGTLTHEEAEEMHKLIDGEFENIDTTLCL